MKKWGGGGGGGGGVEIKGRAMKDFRELGGVHKIFEDSFMGKGGWQKVCFIFYLKSAHQYYGSTLQWGAAKSLVEL